MNSSDRLQQVLIWVGAAGLLTATAVDTLAMLGRHLRIPLLGSIEIVQCAVLVAASVSLVVATQRDTHARVHLLLDRMTPPQRQRADRLHALGGVLFVLALLVGSAWITRDLWGGHEESELLQISYRPLRVAVLLMLLWLLSIYVKQVVRGVRR